MKLARLAIFGVGYVLGARAGRERYGQIVEMAHRASQRLDDYSRRSDNSVRAAHNDARDDS